MGNPDPISQIGYGALFISIFLAVLIALIITKALKNAPKPEDKTGNVYKLQKSYMSPILVFSTCGIFIVLGVIIIFSYIIAYGSNELHLSSAAPFVGISFIIIPVYIIYRFNKHFSQYLIIKIKGDYLEICYPKNPSQNKLRAIKDCEFNMLEWWSGGEGVPYYYAGPVLNLKYNKNEPGIYIRTRATHLKWKNAKKSTVLEVMMYFLYEENWRKLVRAFGLEDELKQ